MFYVFNKSLFKSKKTNVRIWRGWKVQFIQQTQGNTTCRLESFCHALSLLVMVRSPQSPEKNTLLSSSYTRRCVHQLAATFVCSEAVVKLQAVKPKQAERCWKGVKCRELAADSVGVYALWFHPLFKTNINYSGVIIYHLKQMCMVRCRVQLLQQVLLFLLNTTLHIKSIRSEQGVIFFKHWFSPFDDVKYGCHSDTAITWGEIWTNRGLSLCRNERCFTDCCRCCPSFYSSKRRRDKCKCFK